MTSVSIRKIYVGCFFVTVIQAVSMNSLLLIMVMTAIQYSECSCMEKVDRDSQDFCSNIVEMREDIYKRCLNNECNKRTCSLCIQVAVNPEVLVIEALHRNITHIFLEGQAGLILRKSFLENFYREHQGRIVLITGYFQVNEDLGNAAVDDLILEKCKFTKSQNLRNMSQRTLSLAITDPEISPDCHNCKIQLSSRNLNSLQNLIMLELTSTSEAFEYSEDASHMPVDLSAPNLQSLTLGGGHYGRISTNAKLYQIRFSHNVTIECLDPIPISQENAYLVLWDAQIQEINILHPRSDDVILATTKPFESKYRINLITNHRDSIYRPRTSSYGYVEFKEIISPIWTAPTCSPNYVSPRMTRTSTIPTDNVEGTNEVSPTTIQPPIIPTDNSERTEMTEAIAKTTEHIWLKQCRSICASTTLSIRATLLISMSLLVCLFQQKLQTGTTPQLK